VKSVHYLANISGVRWTLGRAFAANHIVTARNYMDNTAVPFSSNPELRNRNRYQLFMRDAAAADFTHPARK
jgi:hypothetical protein